MSARCTGMVFERYPSGGGEFALALALADNAHDDGTHIYPGLDEMARKSRQDVRSVQRHLKSMLASAWLLLVRRSVRGRGTEYRINPAWLRGDSLSPQCIDTTAALSGDNLSPQKSGDVTSAPHSGDTMSPQKPANGVTNDADTGDKRRSAYKNQTNLIPPNPPAGAARREDRNTGTAGHPPDAAFEAIAARYPRRARLDLAWRAWSELLPADRAQGEQMLRAIAAWESSPEWQREHGRYRPRLDKWLRDRRWLDAPGCAAPASPPVASLPPAAPSAPMPADVRAKIDAMLGPRRRKPADPSVGAGL